MEKVEYPVKNSSGKEVSKTSLAAAVFGAEPNKNLVQETVRWQRNKKRAGTHATILRGEMLGGGKKPFKQKGTGRARAGSIISPLWVGGAVVFGPQPRDYEFRLSKRSRRTALISTLSQKVADSALVVVEDFASVDGKTKSFVQVLKALGIDGKKIMLIVADKDGNKACDSKVWKAARNVAGVKPVAVEGVNVYDLLNSAVVLICKTSVAALEARLSK